MYNDDEIQTRRYREYGKPKIYKYNNLQIIIEEPMAYIYLLLAIIAEVVGTSALKASDGFKNWIPNVIVIVGYGLAFYFLSLVLKTIPVGVAYAIWSGLGIVLISLVGYIYFKQRLDFPAVIGMALIISGVIVINIFSKTKSH